MVNLDPAAYPALNLTDAVTAAPLLRSSGRELSGASQKL
jgi:hypothetical protein